MNNLDTCEECGLAKGKQMMGEVEVDVRISKIDLSHIKDAEGKITIHNWRHLCDFNDETTERKSCFRKAQARYEVTAAEIKAGKYGAIKS